jgi:hypothetical protein
VFKRINFIVAVLLMLASSVHAAEAVSLSDTTNNSSSFIMHDKLSKTHYSWGINPSLLTSENIPLWTNYAQITGALSLPMTCPSLPFNTRSFNYCCDICKATNTALAINFSPWHCYYRRKAGGYPKDMPITVPAPSNYHDVDVVAELNAYNNYLNDCASHLAAYNLEHNCNIKIQAVMLDCERFAMADYYHWFPQPEPTNIKVALNTFTKMTSAVFPDASIFWYEHAIRLPGTNLTNSWSGLEITTALCPSWYWFFDADKTVPPENSVATNLAYNATLAASMGVSQIVPYITLGCGYIKDSHGIYNYENSIDYDPALDAQLGAYIASQPEISAVIFFPSPWATANPNWEKHFNAYCNGFNSVTIGTCTVTVNVSNANDSNHPSGTLNVTSGSTQQFTAVPLPGYTVDTWTLDNTITQSGGMTYTLDNIVSNHTISVSFKPLTYNITTSVSPNGSLDPANVIVNYGDNQTFIATPSSGYTVAIWALDGKTVQNGGITYTLNNITGDHTVSVTFKPSSYTVTTSAGSYGTISPASPTVNYGANQIFTAKPSSGYAAAVWTLDGTIVQSGGTTYNLKNIDAAHKISVTFKRPTCTVTTSAGTGAIIPANPTVNYGSSQTFIAKPPSGYAVAAWALNGKTIQNTSTVYTLYNIISDCRVSLTFKKLTYTVMTSAGSCGTISPANPNVGHGANQVFTAKPSSGYKVAAWTLDGKAVQTGGTMYTLKNVTGPHAVFVTFKR